jgi:hypothetical protein
MALKFRRGTTAQKSGSLAFGEPYVNTTLGTLQIGTDSGDVTLTSVSPTTALDILSISASSFVSASTIYATNGITGSIAATNAIVSGSSQIVALLPSGVVSGSIQVLGGTNIISGASQITPLLPTGVISGSAQLSGATIQNLTIQNLTTVNETASVLFSSGSNKFGDFGDDIHSFTGSVQISGSITTIGTSTATAINGIINATNGVVSGSSQIIGILSSLNTYTGSNDTLNTLQSTRIDQLAASTASVNLYTGSNDTLNTLQSTRIDQLAASTASVNSFTASNGNTSLNSYTASLKNAISVTGSALTIYGNLNVEGTTTTVSASNLSITDNLIYLNDGSNITDPDLGWTGNYNDGIYRHAGMFRDASDSGIFKIFKNYTPEPSQSIDTTHGSFTLADLSVGTIYGTIAARNGVVSGSSQVSYLGLSNIPAGIVSGSIQVLGGTGIVSSSAQIDALFNIDGVFSGSSQVDATATTNWSTGIKTQLNTNTVVSGSSQITLSSTTGGGTSDNVRFGSLGIGMAASGTSGRIDAANDVVAYSTSDIRLKENIKPIENAIEKIRKISGNTYDWKSELKDVHGYEGNDVGVIAQEVESVLPQLVQDRDNGYKAVKYDKLVALLIEGIKEQQIKIDNLTIEVENLKKQKGL